MKAFSWLAFLLLPGLSIQAAVTGQWDFDNGDLAATVGSPLQYRGTTASQTQFGSTTFFGIVSPGGQVAQVMRFPATTSSQGYVMPHGAAPNGGGSKVNQYTLILDVLFPSTSTGYRVFWQTDTNNSSDGDLFVNGANAIGISSTYQGNLTPDVWHRVAFTVDLTRRELGKYIDGTNVVSTAVGSAPLGTNRVQYLDSSAGGVDGRWALDAAALLFADDNNETGVGYVDSIQVQDRVLTASEIAGLGGPNGAGIPGWTGGGIAQWDFDGNLASSTSGSNLVALAASPASIAGVTFTNTTIGGKTAKVAAFTRGTYFRLAHGFSGNGGGSFLNQYTLILDVLFPSLPSGWTGLWQTSPNNANDGDWFLNSAGGLGISGIYGGSVTAGAWHRMALVVDTVAGTFTSYLNGTQVQQITGLTLDGRWALDSTALLFADESQENAAGYVNSVQLRNRALTAAAIAELGGAQADGIPIPQQPSGLRLVSPNGGEVFNAGTTQTVAWVVDYPSGLAQVDLMLGSLLYRSLGQVLLQQSNFSWAIESRLGDTNDYRIRLTSVDFSSLQDASDNPFSVVGSGVPPNLLFSQPLQVDGGFESGLTNWQVIAGHPTTLTGADGKGSPCSGLRFLHGGLSPGGDMTVRQDIDLLAKGFTAEDLDAGAVLDAEAWLRNAYSSGSFDSQAYLRVAYLDSARQELASARSLVAGNSAWTRRTVLGRLPPGTRGLRVDVCGSHRRDSDNNSMADDVAVRLQPPASIVSPQITLLPLLQDYRQDAMSLFWETDGNLASPAIDWGRGNVAENTFIRIESVMLDSTHFVHRATLTGLEPETGYVYRVRNGSTVSATYSFRTAPRSNTPFAVAWWADSQTGPTVLQQLIPDMLARGVDWVGVAGDLVSNGASLSDWRAYWFGALETRNFGQTHPALFARGNHDGEYPYCYAYSLLPNNGAWYAFDYGNSRFIFLDSEASTSLSPAQYSWLVSELQRPETQRAAFRVVCFHKLPYANLWNGGGYTGESWVRSDWVPLFQQYHVDVVINGHAHNYNRGVTNGVTYIVTGGGGGGLDTERVAYWPLFTVEYSRYHYDLMQVRSNLLTWNTYDTSGQPLDSFLLRSRVPQLGLRPADGQNLDLVLEGKPGETYVIESTSTLANWTAFSSNAIPDSGTVTNRLTSDGTGRFFRARIGP